MSSRKKNREGMAKHRGGKQFPISLKGFHASLVKVHLENPHEVPNILLQMAVNGLSMHLPVSS